MMGDLHRGLVSLDAPLCDVDTGFNPFGPYPQIPSLGIPCLGIPTMSWSSTDHPALLSQLEEKPPSFSWQAESCLQQSLQYSAHGTGYNSQMEMLAALNADPYSPSVNELSQMVQLYSSMYQDQYNGLSPLDTISFQSEQPLPLPVPSSSDVLQVVSSSGSHDSLSTSTETWRSDGCAPPNYDNVLANLNDSASVTLARDSLKNSWMNHIPDASPSSTSRPSGFDVLPARSVTDPPAFKRPRTWDEALQQGSTENKSNLRYPLAAKPSLKLECSLGPHASPFQGRLSGYSDNRFKPAATSVEPQSVAARHRRKKISERMRVLEKLIPGSNKMDTATMLDEAIEYVKFLQLQVQILENDSQDDVDNIQPPASSSSNNRKSMEGDLSLMRPPATGAPLVLSELLQQQLFKQKLCLVSIRQCPPRTPPPTNVSRKN